VVAQGPGAAEKLEQDKIDEENKDDKKLQKE